MKKILIALGVCLAFFAFMSCGEDEDTDSYISITITGAADSSINGSATWTQGFTGLAALLGYSGNIPLAIIDSAAVVAPYYLTMFASETTYFTMGVPDFPSSSMDDAIMLQFNSNLLNEFGGTNQPGTMTVKRLDKIYQGNITTSKMSDVSVGDLGKFVNGSYSGTVTDGTDTITVSGKFNLRIVQQVSPP